MQLFKKKKEFKKVDLDPVKDLIKEKVSDGDLSNSDISDILDKTRDLYKQAPLTETDVLKIYNTMVDELGAGNDKKQKVPILLKIAGVITIIAWLLLIPSIIEGISYVGELIEGASDVITNTTLILIVLYLIVNVGTIICEIVAGILMILNKRTLAGRFLYAAIALICADLLIVTSLEGVSENFLWDLVAVLVLVVVSVYLHPQLYRERRFYRMIRQLDDEVRYKEGRLGLSVDPNKGYIELDFFNLFWIFIAGCIAGLLAEYAYHIVAIWGFDTSQWYDRAGLLFGPFSPIYGFGALFMTLFLNRFRNMNVILLFCMTTLIGGAFEFFVSWFLEVSFGIQAWNYANEFLSIGGGRTCLKFAAMFGIMGLVWIKWALPAFMKLINLIPWKLRYPITFIAAVFMIINCIMTLQSIDCWAQRQAGKTPVTPIEQFYEKNYDDESMQKRFASMSFQQEKSSRQNLDDAIN